LAFESNVIIDEPEKRSYNIVVKHIVKWKLSYNKIIYKQYEIGIIPLHIKICTRYLNCTRANKRK
jgi:hypothetical protein